MAEDRSRTQNRERSSEIQRSPERGSSIATRREPFDIFSGGPFAMMRRMQDEFDRMIGDFGLGRGLSSLSGRGEHADWAPAIDVFQRGNELVVRADVPGLSREDLSVEIGDDALTISGERKHEHEERHEGMFRSERSYGSFCRVVPLPEGAVAESAKANFKNGVLEVVVQTPPQEVRRGRQIEIEGSDKK